MPNVFCNTITESMTGAFQCDAVLPPVAAVCDVVDPATVLSGVTINGVTGTLLASTIIVSRISGRCSTIEVATGESVQVKHQIANHCGDPVDLTGAEGLRFRVWNRSRETTIDVLAAGLFGGFCATIPDQDKQNLSSEWSLRSSTGQVIAGGPFRVRGWP